MVSCASKILNMSKKENTLLIIDSFALIFRAYYAYPPTLTNSQGEPTNAIFGFTTLMLDVIKKFKPSHIVAVFDSQAPVIRQTEFVLYKANRKETDNELLIQIPRVREVIETFGIPVLSVDGYEADDIIATIDKRHSGKWAQTIIVTGDQDLFQLVDEDTFVYLAGRKFSESKLYMHEDVVAKLGIQPNQVPDYKGLAGDASDNIPGVQGIGKKSAEQLIQQFGSIENVYENLDKVSSRQMNCLVNNYEIAIKSKQLATVEADVPISFDFSLADFKSVDLNSVYNVLNQLDFKSLVKKVDQIVDELGLRENIGLFDMNQDSNYSDAAYEDFDLDKLKDAEKIFLFAKYKHLDKSPLHWDFETVEFTLDGSVIYKVRSQDLKDFWSVIIDKQILVNTFGAKEVIHSLLNNNLAELSDLDTIFNDLGFASFIYGGGMIKFELKSALEYLKIDHKNELLGLFELSNLLAVEFKKDSKLLDVFLLEQSILPTVVKMERTGIILSKQTIAKFENELSIIKENIQQEIYKDVGHEFNINSPRQVGEVLFNEKKLAGGKKTKGGALSTNEQVLRKLVGVDPTVEKILEYREVDKLLSTYIKTLPDYVDSDGRIHSVFDQFGAVSGRFSSKNPNLQNIPAVPSFGIHTRNAFEAEKGSIFVGFDYSQQELRILSALSQEPEMINSFNNSKDIHKLTASELFNVDFDSVTPEQRDVGKTINFSIVYGISAFGLSERMQIDRDLASEFIHKYYRKYPGIKSYFEEQKKKIFQSGASETVLGRKRVVDFSRLSNRFAREAVERELLNFTMQGTAADIMKQAMGNIATIIEKYPAKLLLQIHDEFVFEYQPNEAVANLSELANSKLFIEFAKDIKDCMNRVVDLGVKYDVSIKVGKTWGQMEKLHGV